MNSEAERRLDADLRAGPVSGEPHWFGRDHKPFVLRVEQSLTFEVMVAALYGVAEPEDIASAEDLCGCVAVTLVIEGLPGLEARALKLRTDEERGAVESPDFLALCRQRVASLLSPQK